MKKLDLRETLLDQGPEKLADAALLDILFGTGCKGKSALELGQELLFKFGDLRNLLEAPIAQLKKINGLGEAQCARLRAIMELDQRYLKQRLQQCNIFKNRHQVYQFLIRALRSKPYEVFACLFLDSQNRLIEFKELFKGTFHKSHVHPREIVRATLDYNAVRLIFAHNHPQSFSKPSESDKNMTAVMSTILASIDTTLMDHIIVGSDDLFSFKEHGLI